MGLPLGHPLFGPRLKLLRSGVMVDSPYEESNVVLSVVEAGVRGVERGVLVKMGVEVSYISANTTPPRVSCVLSSSSFSSVHH